MFHRVIGPSRHPGDPRRPHLWCWGGGDGWSGDVAPAEQCGAGEQDSGTPLTLGITRPVRHRPSGHKLSRPPMPQGLSAHRPTAYQGRPGRMPAQRRLAACPSTRKRAPKKTPGPAWLLQPARYGAARTAAARRTAGGSRTRTAAQPALPRTRRPPPAGQFRDSPKLVIMCEPRFRRPGPSGTPYSAPRAQRRRPVTGHSWSRLLPGLMG